MGANVFNVGVCLDTFAAPSFFLLGSRPSMSELTAPEESVVPSLGEPPAQPAAKSIKPLARQQSLAIAAQARHEVTSAKWSFLVASLNHVKNPSPSPREVRDPHARPDRAVGHSTQRHRRTPSSSARDPPAPSARVLERAGRLSHALPRRLGLAPLAVRRAAPRAVVDDDAARHARRRASLSSDGVGLGGASISLDRIYLLSI